MSFNGSGTFVINSAGQPVVSGTVISSTAFNALTADLANGLSTCITKDGQTTPTADIPMGSNKITGLANGTAAGDAANLGQVQSTVAKLLGSVSGADTITAVGAPTVAAYAAGQMFYFVAAAANTGAVTINIDSLGAKSITRDGTTALAAGDIQSGEVCVIVYDGTQFQLVNGASQSASITTENLTVNKATVLNESGGDNDTRIEGDTDSNLLFVDASTDRVGVGTDTPGSKLSVTNSVATAYNASNTLASGQTARISNTNTGSSVAATLIFEATGGGGGNGLGTISGVNTGTGSLALTFGTRDSGGSVTEHMRLNSAGNLGLGVTPSFKLDISGGGTTAKINTLDTNDGGASLSTWMKVGRRAGTGTNAYINTLHDGSDAVSALTWAFGTSSTGTEVMRLDSSGNLGVGVTPTATAGITELALGSASTNPRFSGIRNNSSAFLLESDSAGSNLFERRNLVLTFGTNNTERARITSGGVFCVGTTSTDPRVDNVAGVAIGVATGIGIFSRTSGPAIDVNRKTDDGTLVNFAQDGTIEGTISVSGATVSYNAFAGSHWSQLQDGSKPDILRGTVMESINELCVWPGEENERLPKAKISDTAGSKKVYGVFMAWDNDWTETNDMYVTAVGAFICRVNSAVTVQEGDLLESNGDGTARVQADDIIRSSTIGKVTSTVKTHEYDDGSYCVPTVLYCG